MKKIIFSVLLLMSFELFAQDFDSLAHNIADQLENVTAGKKEYQQTLEVQEPGVVTVKIEVIDSKGKTKTNDYLFNLADIDPNTVRATAKRDVITINVSTNKKQKLIKKTVNNEKVSYINNFVLYGSDIDNGRAIAKSIKAAIPAAKKILDKRLSLSGYNDRLQWLQDHIGSVDLVKKQIEQNLSLNEQYPGAVVLHKKVAAGKSEKDYRYSFNLANLNPKRIDFFVSGNTFGLKLETKHGNKLINVVENNEPKAYTNKINMACKSVEAARDIQKVLTDIIPLAEQKFKASLPQISQLSQGYDVVNPLIEKVTAGSYEYSQDLSGNCMATLTQNVTGNKKSYEDIYEFNWADLNPNQIKPKTKGKYIVIELKTKGKNKFIKHMRSGELSNYTAGVEIYVPGAEEAVIIQNILKKMVNICTKQEETKMKKPLSFSQGFDLLQNNIKNFNIGDTSYEQTVSLSDDNKSLKYTNIIAGSKSSKEYLYEVNLADLNPKSIKIKVSGKKITVEIASNHMEKLIKYYKDGKIQSYQNKINFYAPGIATAKNITRALKAMTK